MKTPILRAGALALCLAVSPPAAAQAPAAPAAQSPAAEMTAAQWREDLRFMAAEMERRHANLYHSVSRERFAAAVADLDARIPTLQRNEIIVGMMRIAAMVGDGHSRVDPRKDARFGFPSLPLKLYLFEDGVYVRAAMPAQAALVGARVEAIGGVPIEEALRRVSELASRDNEIGPRLFAPLYLAMPDILHALGMAPRRDAATLTLRKGRRTWTVTVPAGAVDPLWPPDTDISLVTPEGWVDARTTPAPPLWLQAPLDYHRLVEIPERRALYVQLNMVTNIAGQTLEQFGARIGERARAANPRAVVIDLRLNHGGNHDLRHRFVRELIRVEDADTRLFVLTWRGAFSATEAILVDLDRLTDAVFIGEPASSRPNSYSDAYRMPLPNSGINVRSSIQYNQLAGPEAGAWTPIDIAVPLTFADYAAGRDPVLAAALDHGPVPALREALAAAARAGGAAGAQRAAEAYLADPRNRYANRARQLAGAAQGLFGGEQREAAILVAETAGRHFPDDAYAMNVLAHLAAAMGRADAARRAARRVLELDPNNREARSLIERLDRAAG